MNGIVYKIMIKRTFTISPLAHKALLLFFAKTIEIKKRNPGLIDTENIFLLTISTILFYQDELVIDIKIYVLNIHVPVIRTMRQPRSAPFLMLSIYIYIPLTTSAP